MDYEQAKAYLEATLSFGINLGLERMSRLCVLLGNPQKNLRCIHIAGTNGKGSTASYVTSILSAAGMRAGLFTSPFLTRLTERIRIIDGNKGLQMLEIDESYGEISQNDFARGMTLVGAAVKKMLAEGYDQPTEFELLTALAFWYFHHMRCDIVILETGLGGRLDSTNVIEKPVACIITSLGYDHMDRLGATMKKIASEKAGIIKEDVDVFLYDPQSLQLSNAEQEQITSVMQNRCRDMKSRLHIVDFQDVEVLQYDLSGQKFTCRGERYSTRLLGVAQPLNAALAVKCCLALQLADVGIIKKGIAAARWPARMELLRLNPPVLMDGAHNLQSCQVLSRSLDRLIGNSPVVFLAGFLRDKDYSAMLDEIFRSDAAYRPAFIVCASPNSPRALPANDLAAEVKTKLGRLHKRTGSGYNVQDAIIAEENIDNAASRALQLADEMQLPLCVFGSFYLVGAVRPVIFARRADSELG